MIDNEIEERMQKRIPYILLKELNLNSVYIGGNGCNRSAPNDIDIFPTTYMQFFGIEETLKKINGLQILCRTPNATTISYCGHTIQLCNYYHPSLVALVESFDFAHIQIGIRVEDGNIKEVYYTQAWTDSKLLESTKYVKSAFPLSSLIRSFKYKERGNFAGNSHIWSVLLILTDIVDRGFIDYADFKNQLDAVDLGLLPEEMEGGADALYKLFTRLRRDI